MSSRRAINKEVDENGEDQIDKQFHPADVDIFNSSSSKFMSKQN